MCALQRLNSQSKDARARLPPCHDVSILIRFNLPCLTKGGRQRNSSSSGGAARRCRWDTFRPSLCTESQWKRQKPDWITFLPVQRGAALSGICQHVIESLARIFAPDHPRDKTRPRDTNVIFIAHRGKRKREKGGERKGGRERRGKRKRERTLRYYWLACTLSSIFSDQSLERDRRKQRRRRSEGEKEGKRKAGKKKRGGKSVAVAFAFSFTRDTLLPCFHFTYTLHTRGGKNAQGGQKKEKEKWKKTDERKDEGEVVEVDAVSR